MSGSDTGPGSFATRPCSTAVGFSARGAMQARVVYSMRGRARAKKTNSLFHSLCQASPRVVSCVSSQTENQSNCESSLQALAKECGHAGQTVQIGGVRQLSRQVHFNRTLVAICMKSGPGSRPCRRQNHTREQRPSKIRLVICA